MIDDVDDGNARRIHLLNARNHGLRIDGDENDSIRAFGDHVLNLAHLFRNAIGLRRDVVHDARVHLLGRAVGAKPHGLKKRIRLVLGKNRDSVAFDFSCTRGSHSSQNGDEDECSCGCHATIVTGFPYIHRFSGFLKVPSRHPLGDVLSWIQNWEVEVVDGWTRLLTRWTDAGVIDEETAARIRAFEMAHSGSTRLRWPIWIA